MLEAEIRKKILESLGSASVCWSDMKDGSSGVPHGEFDSTKANKIADDLLDFVWDKLTSRAWLGNATTGELLDEIKTRLEVSDMLDYTTTEGGK